MILAIVMGLAAATVFLSRAITGSWFAPPGVFGAIWGGSLGMLTLTTAMEFPLQSTTWHVIIIAWLSFLLGSLLAGPGRTTESSGGLPEIDVPPGTAMAVKLASLMALAGSIRFAWIALGEIGLYQYLTHPLTVRYLLTAGGVSTGTLTPVFQSVTLMAAACGGAYAAIRPQYVWAYGAPVAAAVFDTLSFGRAHTLVTLLIFSSAYCLVKAAVPRRERRMGRGRRWVLVLVAAVVAIPYGYVSLIRDRPSVKGVLGMLQTYSANLTQNWYLVDDVITRRDAPRPGVNTMLPALLVLHKMGFRATDPRHEQLFALSGRDGTGRMSNTYTVVGASYADFGILGAAFYMFVLGYVSNLLFVLYRRRPRWWQVGGLCFVYPMLLFTVQGHQLSSPPFVFALGTSLGIAVVLSRLRQPAVVLSSPQYLRT
jgi:oligosaccharide repeat unit polymerase